MLNKILSVCCEKDIKTWVIAAEKIIENIKSQEYYLVVPDDEIEVFKHATPENYNIIPESEIVKDRNIDYFRNKLPDSIKFRAGWYLQQFIKIEFFRYGIEKKCLIWDADTVPIKNISFVDKDEKFLFYKGVDRPKFHQPYFDLITKILGLERIYQESFISQNFPLNSEWVATFCAEIESRNNVTCWIDAILSNLDHSNSISGFSEYETLGVYISHKYKNDFKFMSNQYFTRNGTALLGGPENLNSDAWCLLKNNYDFISFEETDKSNIKGINIGCGNDRRIETFKGNIFLNVDLEKYEAVDMVMDVTQKWPFPDLKFEHIVANNIAEHVDDVINLFNEIDRCLEIGGILNIEVPFIGSFNHGTDVTHKRGLTYESFNFLFSDDRNYLFREKSMRKFNYKVINFFREDIKDSKLIREYFDSIPIKGTYIDWIIKIITHQIPGTFGMTFQKVS